MNGEDYKEMLAAHALDALDANESRETEARLAADRALVGELEEWRDVTALLALSAEPVEPAPELRTRILEKIRRTRQNSNEGSDERNNFAAQNIKPPTASNVVQFAPRENRSVWAYVPTIGAIAASLIALFLAISLYTAINRDREKNERLAELNQRLSEAEQKLNATQGQLEQIRQEREMLGSPATIVASLNGAENVPQARARLVFDKQTGKAMLFVEGLPHAPQGKIYQVWFIADPNRPAPGATFETDEGGKAVLRDQMPNEVLKAQKFAVTLEPEGGSPAPTSKPYLVGSSL